MSRLKMTGLLLSLTMLAASAGIGEDLMSVQIKEGQLRATPSFLGKVVARIRYGDQVEVLREEGKWVQARSGRKTGWIHESALTEKKIVLAAGKKDVETAASSDELALAGKGFNADVEKEFKAQNRDIDFTWVDWMEKLTISPKEMVAFLKKGGVQSRQGGGQ